MYIHHPDLQKLSKGHTFSLFIVGIGHKPHAADLSNMNVIPRETGLGIEATMRYQSSFSGIDSPRLLNSGEGMSTILPKDIP